MASALKKPLRRGFILTPSIGPTRRRRRVTPAMRRRRDRQNCYCGGWFWPAPHRRGSMAAEHYFKVTGIVGCHHGKLPQYILDMEREQARQYGCPF